MQVLQVTKSSLYISSLRKFPLQGNRGGLFYGHGATVAYGSPKPLIWVRILVPVLNNVTGKKYTASFKIFKLIEFMSKLTAYIKDSYRELLEKVTWPTWDQLQQSTMIVLGATLVITLMVGLMDALSSNTLKLIYSFF
jgi:preprotein translocase subunit SecE